MFKNALVYRYDHWDAQALSALEARLQTGGGFHACIVPCARAGMAWPALQAFTTWW